MFAFWKCLHQAISKKVTSHYICGYPYPGGANILHACRLDLGPWVSQILPHCFLRWGATPTAKAQTSYIYCKYLLNIVVNFQSNKNIYAHPTFPVYGRCCFWEMFLSSDVKKYNCGFLHWRPPVRLWVFISIQVRLGGCCSIYTRDLS